MSNVDFTSSNCGSDNGTAINNSGLQVGDQVEINGATDLSSCIVSNKGGCVYEINLTANPPGSTYAYCVNVLAQGPEGFGSGSLNLAFTDSTSSTYQLNIDSSTEKQHTVQYNSDSPAITEIQWSWSPIP